MTVPLREAMRWLLDEAVMPPSEGAGAGAARLEVEEETTRAAARANDELEEILIVNV